VRINLLGVSLFDPRKDPFAERKATKKSDNEGIWIGMKHDLTMLTQRVIVLGASNVVRNMSVVVETARRMRGTPIDLLAAIGHGRSYGQTSWVLGRSLPGILQCELWNEWHGRTALPTAALLTDIGNDILLGASPNQIVSWVKDCLRRLRPACEQIVITELPLENVLSLGPRRFLALRTMLYPRSRISWEQALESARTLNASVVDLAREFDGVIIRPQPDWYGFDPIHIRGRRSCQAWNSILAPLASGQSVVTGQSHWQDRLRLLVARPKYRCLFGFGQTCAQPAARLPDGTCVSLY
jgi:hypothetical protein